MVGATFSEGSLVQQSAQQGNLEVRANVSYSLIRFLIKKKPDVYNLFHVFRFLFVVFAAGVRNSRLAVDQHG